MVRRFDNVCFECSGAHFTEVLLLWAAGQITHEQRPAFAKLND